MAGRNCCVPIPLIGVVLTLASCAYRLPHLTPPSQEPIRVIANAPEQYSVQVNTGTIQEYGVPDDGRIEVEVPSYRASCAVYLFNAIKVRGYGDPLKTWTVSVTRNGNTLRKQSLRVTHKSPTDNAGYHILKIAP